MANDFILVLDFGGQQAQSMARKLRGQNYYCEVHPGDISPETVSRKAPRGLLLAGGSDGRPLNAELLRLGLPVLARLPIDPQTARLCDEGHIERVDGAALQGAVDAIEAKVGLNA